MCNIWELQGCVFLTTSIGKSICLPMGGLFLSFLLGCMAYEAELRPLCQLFTLWIINQFFNTCWPCNNVSFAIINYGEIFTLMAIVIEKSLRKPLQTNPDAMTETTESSWITWNLAWFDHVIIKFEQLSARFRWWPANRVACPRLGIHNITGAIGHRNPSRA